MEGINVNVVSPLQFFWFLKGRWHGNQFCGKIVAKLHTQFCTYCTYCSVISKRMGYCYLDVRINSAYDTSIIMWQFREIRSSNSELTELICERQVRHGQKTRTFSRISPDILDWFLQSFHRMKALYVQMMDLYLIFQFFNGRCYGNQIMLRKCFKRRLIPLAFIALVLENELQYHGLAVCINIV